MYAIGTLRKSSSLKLPLERMRSLRAHVRSAVLLTGGSKGAHMWQDVLRLDIVSGLGETPAAYGWHVDPLLNVRLQPEGESGRALFGSVTEREDTPPPDRGRAVGIYQVPHSRSDLRPRVIQSGLATDAA